MEKMINAVINTIEMLMTQVNRIDADKKEEFVKDVYNKTEEIYLDFRKTLKHVYDSLDSDNITIDEAVKYLDNSRLPFISIRSRIRGYVIHPFYDRDENASGFAIGIMGVLMGGLHDTTEAALGTIINENDLFTNYRIQLKGHHTIVDIINLYDRNKESSLFFSDYYQQYKDSLKRENEIKKRLQRDLKKQIEKIDSSWNRVNEYYPKILFPCKR